MSGLLHSMVILETLPTGDIECINILGTPSTLACIGCRYLTVSAAFALTCWPNARSSAHPWTWKADAKTLSWKTWLACSVEAFTPNSRGGQNTGPRAAVSTFRHGHVPQPRAAPGLGKCSVGFTELGLRKCSVGFTERGLRKCSVGFTVCSVLCFPCAD